MPGFLISTVCLVKSWCKVLRCTPKHLPDFFQGNSNILHEMRKGKGSGHLTDLWDDRNITSMPSHSIQCF